MGKFELSLASNYVADWTIADAVREYFQNALDQEATQEDNKMFVHYDGVHLLQIGNKKSVLSAKTLLLGATTKQDDDKTIGQFGEGYKIATLVALRCAKQVTFYNYGKKEIWKPRMVKSRRYEGAEVLTFFTEKFIWNKPPHNNLIIAVDGISPEEWELIKENNLHLQEDIGEIIQTSKGRILKADKYKGKIFVNGLYVRTEKDMDFGYDILPKYLKLDRDRKMVSTFDLQWFTSTMWSEVKSEEIVEVAKKGSGDAKYLGAQSYSSVQPMAAFAAHKIFREEHGDKAIPVSNQEELKSVQEKYQDAKAVLVPETFKRMVTEAKEYEVKAEPKAAVTKEEKLLMWFGKVKEKLTEDEQKEFLEVMGKKTEDDDMPF